MILQFFKWIVKIFVKLTVGLIKFLFDVIKAFFSGNKKQGTVSRTDNEDQPEKLWLYDDFISDMNALKSKFSGEELSNQSLKLVVNLLVNFNISAEDKCRGLQESKAIVKEACNNDSFSIITFWSKSITASYTILEGMVANRLLLPDINKNSTRICQHLT